MPDATDFNKFQMAFRKDQGHNILQYEKQTRLINSLLYAEHLPKILGIYREFAE